MTTTTDEALTITFTHTRLAWREYADTNRAEGFIALADAVTAALDTLPPTVRVDPPVTMTITRHDDAGSHYTVTARYQRGRRAATR